MLSSENSTPEGEDYSFPSKVNFVRNIELNGGIDGFYRKRHAEHKQDHIYMILIMIFFIFGVQVLMFTWKRRHYASYHLFSLVGLWLFPVIFFQSNTSNKLFISIWSLFSIFNGWILFKAFQRPIYYITTRKMYKWFLIMHCISFIVGVFGFVSMMILMFLFSPPENENFSDPITIYFLFLLSNLYFSVLSRDVAELCSNRMTTTLGFYVKNGLPNKQIPDNTCLNCRGYLLETPNSGPRREQEPIHTLNCTHIFHENCLRGWCIFGKKDTCPYCHEKVPLKILSRNVWDFPQELCFDFLKYYIVRVPIMIWAITNSCKFLDLD